MSGAVEGLRARHNIGLLTHVQGQRPQHLWVQRSGMRIGWGSLWADCKEAERSVGDMYGNRAKCLKAFKRMCVCVFEA